MICTLVRLKTKAIYTDRTSLKIEEEQVAMVSSLIYVQFVIIRRIFTMFRDLGRLCFLCERKIVRRNIVHYYPVQRRRK